MINKNTFSPEANTHLSNLVKELGFNAIAGELKALNNPYENMQHVIKRTKNTQLQEITNLLYKPTSEQAKQYNKLKLDFENAFYLDKDNKEESKKELLNYVLPFNSVAEYKINNIIEGLKEISKLRDKQNDIMDDSVVNDISYDEIEPIVLELDQEIDSIQNYINDNYYSLNYTVFQNIE